jgi:hypothetical protein
LLSLKTGFSARVIAGTGALPNDRAMKAWYHPSIACTRADEVIE